MNEQDIYNEYPRKTAKPAALKAIAKALKGYPAPYLMARTKAYARSREGQDHVFTPHPATWFNQERFNDEIEPPNNKAFDMEHLKRIERRISAINDNYDYHMDKSPEHRQELKKLHAKRKEIMERLGLLA